MSREAVEKLPNQNLSRANALRMERISLLRSALLNGISREKSTITFPYPTTYAGKIYESRAEITDPPKGTGVLVYEMLFGNKKK
ncbi:MAG: hypothetical protein R3281_13010 [Balneolaceae bacterium]|nr:hypothetical protein [Balneolaceae bacterium]